MNRPLHRVWVVVALTTASCGGAATKQQTGFTLAAPTHLVAGDTVQLTPQVTYSDGSSEALPLNAAIAWSGVPTVTALDPNSTADSPIPATGTEPVAFFVANPSRTDDTAALANLLVIADPGTSASPSITVTATISGTLDGTATATLSIGAMLKGDMTAGQGTYSQSCAICHGTTGHGTDANADGSFTIDHQSYAFPAPGLNAEMGNAGSDPGWNAALFAMASRVDMDNGGIALRAPMPCWLTDIDPNTLAPPTTQDLADIYAFMQTQNM